MKYLILLIALCIEITLVGQPCTLSNKVIFSTNKFVGLGHPDGLWRTLFSPKLASTHQGIINHPKAFRVSSTDPNWNLTPASIVSASSQARIKTTNKFSSQPWRFGTTLRVTKRLKYKITGEFRCDDHGSFSLVKRNGQVVYSIATPSPGSSSSTTINFNDFLDSGVYYFEIKVFNNNGEYLGFSINGEVTSPEKTIHSTYFSHCQPTTFLSIETIRDKNCNGIFDDGEALLPNATYKYNYGGKPGTVNADNNGEALIAGLSQGNLNLTINPMDGYRPFNNEPTRNITLPPTGVKRVSYFVCKN
ncbi:MAG TPA: hypothetical protein VK169_15085 [Saprospiraceae bacterium]|nr:hypothetical protein [Saprospiraceae bacterium]